MLNEFRQRSPELANMDSYELASKIYKANPQYSDVPFEQFAKYIGAEEDMAATRNGFKDTVGALGAGLKTLPGQVAASAVQAYQGGDVKASDDSWGSKIVKKNEQAVQNYISEYGKNDADSFLGVTPRDVAEAMGSAGFSGVAGGGGLVTGGAVALAPVPGARPAAWATGTAATGKLAYNMARNQITRTFRDSLNESRTESGMPPLTEQEWQGVKVNFDQKAHEYGLWEAIPEAVGSAVGFNLLLKPLTKFIPKQMAGKMVGKLVGGAGKFGGMVGEELATETVTQVGQGAIEADVGLRETAPTVPEAFDEIYGQTVALTGMMGVSAKAAHMGYQALTPSKKPAIETTKPTDLLQENQPLQPPQVQQQAPVRPQAPVQGPGPTPLQTQNQAKINQIGEQEIAAAVNGVFPEVAQNMTGDMAFDREQKAEQAGWPAEIQAQNQAEAERQAQLNFNKQPRTVHQDIDPIQMQREMMYHEGALSTSPHERAIDARAAGRGHDRRFEETQPPYAPQTPVQALADRVYGEKPVSKPVIAGTPEGDQFEKVGTHVDQAAKEAATSPENNTPEPTEPQIKAGNYKKGHAKIDGLDISIENPEGSTRSGTSPDGKKWSTDMQHHYGYIRGTLGNDKDHIDTFINPGTETSPKVFVVDQVDPGTGNFDEHKILLGFPNKLQAIKAYNSNYEKGWKGLGKITETSMDEFKAWAMDGKRKTKPFASAALRSPVSSASGSDEVAQGGAGKTELTKPTKPAIEKPVTSEKGKGDIPTVESSDKPDGGILHKIKNIVEKDDGMQDFGLRVIPEGYEVSPGDKLKNSYEWIDGEKTDVELGGVSAIGVNDLDSGSLFQNIIDLHNPPRHQYSGEQVVLVKGKSAGGGNDSGEILISAPVVVDVFEKKDLPTIKEPLSFREYAESVGLDFLKDYSYPKSLDDPIWQKALTEYKKVEKDFDSFSEFKKALSSPNPPSQPGKVGKEVSEPAPKPTIAKGRKGTAYLPDNTPVKFQYAIADIDDLITSHNDDFSINKDFPQELQPRDRTRDTMKLQISEISNKLNPERLGKDSSVSKGAPIVGEDMVVESGNGRTMAIRKNAEKSKKYHKWAKESAGEFGIDEETEMEKPVLVRIRVGDNVKREDFVKSANKDDVAKLSETEQAIADSETIAQEDLQLFRPGDDGDIGVAGNKPFVSRFIGKMSASEQNAYLTEDGRANQALVKRIQSAIFYKAYEDENILKMITEETSPDIQRILNALTIAAPRFAKAKAIDPEMGGIKIVKHVVGAINFIKDARLEYPDLPSSKGRSKILNQVLKHISPDQIEMFERVETPKPTIEAAKYLAGNAGSAKRMGEFLKGVAGETINYLTEAPQTLLFEEKLEKPGVSAIINKTVSKLEDKYENKQQDLFQLRSDTSGVNEQGERHEDRGEEADQSDVFGEGAETGTGKRGQVSDDTVLKEPSAAFKKEIRFEQQDLFSSKPKKDSSVPGILQNQRTRMATTGDISFSGNVIRDEADAASLLAHIRKLAQEELFTVTTDIDGTILEIHRYSKGTKSSANALPVEVIGKILDTQGVKHLYFAHNHPSGETIPSAGDYNVFGHIQDIAGLKGIQSHMIIVGGTDWFSPKGGGKIRPTIRTTKIPVKTRLLNRSHKIKKGEPLDNSGKVLKWVEENYNGKDALLFLDTKLKLAGVMPFPVSVPISDAAAAIISFAESTNAAGMIIKTQKEMSPDRKEFIRNFGGGISGDGFQVFDVMEGPTSYTDRGRLGDLLGGVENGIRKLQSGMPMPMYSAKSTTHDLSTLSLKDVQSIFKGQSVGQTANGKFWVRTKSGHGVSIETVDSISGNEAAFNIGYGRQQANGEFISGSYQNGTIKISKDIGGKWTLAHETTHFLEDAGLLNKLDTNVLDHAIGKAGFGKGLSPQEARAAYIEQMLESRSEQANTPLGRVLQKIGDFIDALVNLVKKTSRGVVRNVESGKVFERQVNGRTYKTMQPAYDKTASRWYSQMEKTLEQKLPGKAMPKMIKGMVQSWAKKGEFKVEELSWSGLIDWLDEISNSSTNKKGVPDSVLRASNNLSDLRETGTFLSHGYSGVDIPSKIAVLEQVFSAAQNSEIRESIVRLIPVDVVNVLVGKQLSPEKLFDNKSVFLDLFSSPSNSDISGSFVDVAFSLIDAATSQGTKALSGIFDLRRVFKNGLPTVGAGNLNHDLSFFKEGSKVGTKSKEQKITRAQVLDFIRSNNVRVEEVVKESPQFGWLVQDNGNSDFYDNEEDARAALEEWQDESEYIFRSEVEAEVKEQTGVWHGDPVFVVDVYGQTVGNEFETRAEAGEYLEDWIESEVEKQRDMVAIAETENSSGNATKFSDYQLPGGENYKELLVTMPEIKKAAQERRDLHRILTGKYKSERYWDELTEKEEAQLTALITAERTEQSDGGYKSSHWDEPNVLTHVRFSEREVDGQRVLHIEEIQSDWHQEGRKHGYNQGEMKNLVVDTTTGEIISRHNTAREAFKEAKRLVGEGRSVKATVAKETHVTPNAPFKKTWPMLAFKRMVRYAAENGFDTIAWTPGDMQAERYKLSKHINEVHYEADNDNKYYDISVIGKDGTEVFAEEDIPIEKVEELVGKELAKKIQNGEGEKSASDGDGYREWKTFSGLDLDIGGEGMKGFYDKILPTSVNKMFNKKAWGKAKVGTVGIVTEDSRSDFQREMSEDPFYEDMIDGGIVTQKLHSLPITPEMKRKALSEGMPLFSTTKKPAIIQEKFGRSVKTWDQKITDVFNSVKDKAKRQALFEKHVITGGLDKLHPIKQLGDHAYKLHRLETGYQLPFAMFMQNGKLSWNGDALTVTDKDNGVLPFLDSLGKDWEKILYWSAAKRAEVLEGEGRENWLDKESRDKIFEWAGAPDDQAMHQASEKLQEFNKNILDVAQEAGLIDPFSRQTWTKDFYVPFYRIFEDEKAREEFLSSPRLSRKHISSQIKKLKGAKAQLGDPVENILHNWMHLIHESMRNKARGSAFDSAMEIGTEAIEHIEEPFSNKKLRQMARDMGTFKQGMDRKQLKEAVFGDPDYELPNPYATVKQREADNVLAFRRNGEPVYFKVNDPELFEALSNVNNNKMDNILTRMMGTTKRWLSYGATFGPGFRIANVLRDTMHTAIISKNFKVFADSARGFKKSMAEDPDFIAFMASGAGFGSSYTKSDDPQAGAKYIKSILNKDKKYILNTPKKLLEAWERIGDASENAARMMLYKNAIDRGASHLDASFQGRDILDFTMHGANGAVQFLIQTIPFLNARAQGLYKLSRAAKENPKSFLMKGAMLTVASMALWAAYKDDDEYKQLEDWEKWAYYHFWIGDQHYRIPKPFEIGVLFSSMFESAANVMNGNNEAKHLIDFAGYMFTDAFALDWPQFVKPAIEQWANKNSFTGRPIVGPGLKGLPAGLQAEPWTSETMRTLGKALNVSPKRAEELVRAYFSTVGMFVVGASDVAFHHAFDFPEDPSMTIDDYMGIGKFIRRKGPKRNIRELTWFYETVSDIDEVARGVRYYAKNGQILEARELAEKNINKLKLRKAFNKVKKDLTNINKVIKFTHASAFKPEVKRQRIDELVKLRNQKVKRAYEIGKGRL